MLKIKDNVDLKELEKYGFEYLYGFDEYTGEVFIKKIINKRKDFSLIPFKRRKLMLGISGYNRHIKIPENCFDKYYNAHRCLDGLEIENNSLTDIDLLYDLIKADLVEKVEE